MYNEHCFLKQVNNKQGNLPVWKLMEVNSKGQPVEVLLGNGLSTYRNYDTYGYLTSVKTGITETTTVIQNVKQQKEIDSLKKQVDTLEDKLNITEN